jgi:hypothetical protein
MDPNRHSIDHILKLPTPRLLNYYRGLQKEHVSEATMSILKEELDKREHVAR